MDITSLIQNKGKQRIQKIHPNASTNKNGLPKKEKSETNLQGSYFDQTNCKKTSLKQKGNSNMPG